MTKEGKTVSEKSFFRGYKLKELLELKGLTQEKAAELTGVDQTTISMIIKGKNNPKPDTVRKLCQGLHVPSPLYFYNDDDIPLQTLDLPDDLKQFVMDSDSLDYLRLAKRAKRNHLSPEAFEKIIEALEVARLL